MTWHDITWPCMAIQYSTWNDITRHDLAWQDTTAHDMTSHDMTLNSLRDHLIRRAWSAASLQKLAERCHGIFVFGLRLSRQRERRYKSDIIWWNLTITSITLVHSADVVHPWYAKESAYLLQESTGGLWWCACYRRRDRMGRIQDLWLQDPRLLRGLPCHPEKVLLRCWLPVLIAGNGCSYVAQRSDLNLGSEVSISASDSERSQPAKPS